MAFLHEAKLERDVENYLVQETKKLGGKAYKFSSPANKAVPDRLCDLPFSLVKFVECKAPGKKPTPLQLKVHKEMRSRGKDVSVVDTKAGVDILITIWKEEIDELRRSFRPPRPHS